MVEDPKRTSADQDTTERERLAQIRYVPAGHRDLVSELLQAQNFAGARAERDKADEFLRSLAAPLYPNPPESERYSRNLYLALEDDPTHDRYPI
jgi:hypothetical protein